MLSRIKQSKMGSIFIVRMMLSIVLLSFLSTDVHGNRSLRKRVKPDSSSSVVVDSEQNEFGRDFQLFPQKKQQQQSNEQSSNNNTKKNKRRNKQRDIVAVEKEETLVQLEKELRDAEITERILNYMSLSMSIPQTPSPTPAYVAPRTPPPVNTNAPTAPPKVYTSPPTVYINPNPPPTPYGNPATYTPTERVVPTDPPTVKPTIYYEPVGRYPTAPTPPVSPLQHHRQRFLFLNLLQHHQHRFLCLTHLQHHLQRLLCRTSSSF